MTSPAHPGAEPADPQQHAASTTRSTPLAAPVHDGMTAPWALAERVRRSPSAPLVARRPSVGRHWIPMSAAAFQAQVREVAAGLMSLGLRPGDMIAIMSHTCFEWTLLDFAAWEAGLVVVPIYETSSAEQAEWILTDASVRLVVVENAVMEQMIETIRSRGADQAALAELRVMCLSRGAITDLIASGKGVDRAGLDARAAALTSADLATIVYTSGTTGRPKGVELTHGNLFQLGVNACAHVPEVLGADEVRALMFLPLAHVLGRFIEIAIVCSERGVMGHAPDVKHLVDDLATFSPTFVVAVPRVFEKIYNAADARSTGNKQKVFRLAAKTAIAYSRALDTPEGPSRGLRAQMRVFDRLVFSKLRALLGGRVTHVISGGGPLGERLGHYYRGAGVTVLEGYGLTETAAPCAVTLPASMRIGTVGGPMPGTELRLADDGEILVRGIGLFRGYHANPGATAEALTADGWLRTGDIGAFEDDGSLRITGRKKELIVTAGGKNVAPAVLEDRLRGHPLVSQVLVVGDNRPCIGALVTLDAEMLPLWLASHGIEDLDPVSAVSDPRVRAALERAVARANEAVSRAESIRVFTVLPGDFTIDNGLLTPSLKVRRAAALERFADEIDALYRRPVA
ncbi:AMP-dependent synthetase/ligase [Actinomyces marmotae]|uniref:Acyl-CoA synthetase n=1 Tax=Actinomyces marmotae TaxID=2737173 RepID=A0A6M8B665_9ACTO|nr:long-chain fatty acid--CoA ligase [Actinomyces marmotae]QKD80070.1 long-chain fatty acid--CoA ligase [Actinomyces marmotae]